MRYLDKDLRGIPVVTAKGEKIGKLTGFMIDADHHAVAQYVVAKTTWLSALLPGELLVHPSQVISLDDQRMVVKDEAVTAEAEALKTNLSSAPGTTTTATRSEG